MKAILTIILIFAQILLGSTRKLIFVQSLSRHGTRYPLKPEQNDHSWFVRQQNITGELTDQGKHQHYVLGKILYAKYWKRLFGGTEYEFKYHQSQILVRSTSNNRTLDSMEAQILGLLQALPPIKLPESQRENALPAYVNASDYDEKDNERDFFVFGKKHKYFQTLSIHGEKAEVNLPRGLNYTYLANPYDEGDFLHKYLQPYCPRQRLWVAKNIASQKLNNVLDKEEVQNFFKQLAKVVDHGIDFDKAASHIDNYRSLKNMGYPYLQFFDDPYNAHMADFLSEIHFLGRLLLTQTQIQVCNSLLMDYTLGNMKNGATGKGPKFVLYNSHQTTIICMLTALKMTSFDCTVDRFFNPQVDNDEICINTIPLYGATLIFQLYRNQDESLVFKLLYNGVPMKIPICGNKMLCPLEEFGVWVNNFSPIDPNTLCGIDKAPEKPPITVLPSQAGNLKQQSASADEKKAKIQNAKKRKARIHQAFLSKLVHDKRA